MNIRYKFIGILYLCHVFLYASIDDEIEAIQNSPIEQRFELMNALKRKITKMKEEERMQTIEKLQSSTQGEVISRPSENNKTMEETHDKQLTSHIHDLQNHNTINLQEEMMESSQEEFFDNDH